jgi:ubiquinone biosynthesis accessory factor UbiK
VKTVQRTRDVRQEGDSADICLLHYCHAENGGIAMLNTKFFEEMSSKLNELVAKTPAKDFEKNARALLAHGFAKLDLVTREEYEVLAQRLDKLEARIGALETKK